MVQFEADEKVPNCMTCSVMGFNKHNGGPANQTGRPDLILFGNTQIMYYSTYMYSIHQIAG